MSIDFLQVEIPASDDVDEDEKKKKIQALQQQAADRAKILQENIENRRKVMDARQEMRKHEAKVWSLNEVVIPEVI